MASNDTKLGAGYALGMFFHAPEGTELPSYPGETLSEAWTHIGDITEDGISWSTGRTYETIKNWALEIKRLKPGTDPQAIKAPVMDTTLEVFKTIFGADNVTVIDATAEHGKLIKVDTAALNTPTAEAFLFIMKDGNDMIILGTKSGFISELSDISFTPSDSIKWETTISTKSFTLITDDGQKVVGEG